MVDLPQTKKEIDMKGVFKVKINPKGGVINHKDRIVAKRFLQREGIHFE